MIFDFYTSDQHYFHKNIIKYCDRPFSDTTEMRKELISRYNKVVGNNDATLFLGDTFFCSLNEAKSIMHELNGYKYLLRGNHDRKITDEQFIQIGFEAVFPGYFTGMIAGLPVVYSHYPFTGYSEDKRYELARPPKDGPVIIHGHTHEKKKLTNKGTIHIGVDGWDYAPASFSQLKELVIEANEFRNNF